MERALHFLEAERFSDGETTMSKAERPDIHEPKAYEAHDAAELRHLAGRLALRIEKRQTKSQTNASDPCLSLQQ